MPSVISVANLFLKGGNTSVIWSEWTYKKSP